MKKRWKKILSVLMVGTVMVGSLTACGGDKEEKGGKSSDVKVAIICSSAGQNDNGYNQSAVKGAKKAAEELGIEYKVVEPTTGVPQALESLADDGYNFTPADNGGRSVGFIGGTNSNGITVFSYGYLEGINYEAQKLGVNYDYYAKYDAGFADSATGSTVAGTYYNQGANVVFSVAGSVGDGAASKAKEEGKLAIQVDANKDDQQPGYILTSVIKNTEVPVYEIVKEAVAGKIAEMDRVQSYSLASGAASITDLSEISKHVQESGKAKWEEIKTELADIEKKIEDGTIQVTNAQSGEKFDPAKCPNVTIK